jgi:uncharacterized protein YqhQ
MDLNKIFMKNATPTKVGGQAILEGLMMRGSRALAIAVRQPDGAVHLTVEPLKPAGGWKKWPIIRGIVSFVSSLVLGTRILMYSADVLEGCETPEGGPVYEDDKLTLWMNEKFGKEKANAIMMYFSVVLAILLTVGVFIVLPTGVMNLLKGAGIRSAFLLNLIEGVLRICMFVVYVSAISRMPEIRRTFMYHGAEHKTIHCYENGLELTPSNAQQFYTLHPRCGTSFLMFVMVISLLVFSLLGWPNLAARIASRLLLIPVIAGLSYELLQFTGRHDGKCVRALSMPGILLQKLTTKEPTDDMVEVAIIAVKAVLPSHEDPSVPVEYWVGRVMPDGAYVKDEEETAKYVEERKKAEK